MEIVTANPDEPVRTYWQKRLQSHLSDRYRGRALLKFPEDLRMFQHAIEETKPEVIVELGTHDGGSALWFADQLQVLCGHGQVITVDRTNIVIDDPRIFFICGDLTLVSDKVSAVVGGRRAMVIDDSAHDYQTTLASLRLYSPLVSLGCYFIVEDTIVDTDLSIWPNVKGAMQATDAFLAEQSRFERKEMAWYGLTMHMGGWLQAIS
jgi:cephalosporin hydroxylase